MDSIDRAARLLRAAAEFFRSVAEPGTALGKQMVANAGMYEAVAEDLDREFAKMATAGGNGASNGRPVRPESVAAPPRPAPLAPVDSEPTPLLLEHPVATGPDSSEGLSPSQRRYLVKCWREGANKGGPPDFEFLIADAASGEEAVAKGRSRAEQMVRASGRNEQFFCRAQRY